MDDEHDDIYLLMTMVCGLVMFFLIFSLTGNGEAKEIETIATTDYQKYQINETKFIEDEIYRDKILQLHKNEIEIYPDAKLKDRFDDKSDWISYTVPFNSSTV